MKLSKREKSTGRTNEPRKGSNDCLTLYLFTRGMKFNTFFLAKLQVLLAVLATTAEGRETAPTSLGNWLIGLMVGVPLLMVASNIMIINYYSDKMDHGKAYFPKTVAVLALTFAEATIFLLPLDVANGGGAVGCGAWLDQTDLCGNLDLTGVWQGVMLTVFVLCVFIIPLAISYYQAYEVNLDGEEVGSCGSKLCTAFKWQLVSFVVLTPIMFIMYAFLNNTSIPISENSETDVNKFHFKDYDSNDLVVTDSWKASGGEFVAGTMSMPTTFPVYLIASFSFIGWIFFVMYAGIGLVAIPMDLILGFRFRPKPLKQINFIKHRADMATRATEMTQLGEHIKKEFRIKSDSERKKQKTADKKALKQFKIAVMQLEKDWEELQLCEESAYYKNPTLLNTLWPWIQLILGIVSSFISFFWILHICLFQLPLTFGGFPLTPFLNGYFQWFDTWFPLFGVLSVGMFTFYMLLAVMMGNFKFGMRILIIPLHPMKAGKTLMNSILFNINLVLVCTLPTLQFSVDAFSQYARLTDINNISNIQIKYLDFFQFFYKHNIFVLVMLGFFCVAFLYWIVCGCCCGKERRDVDAKKKLEKDLEKVRRKFEKQGVKGKKKVATTAGLR